MHTRPQQLGARGVSMDMKTSWAAQEYDTKFNNLETMVQILEALKLIKYIVRDIKISIIVRY